MKPNAINVNIELYRMNRNNGMKMSSCVCVEKRVDSVPPQLRTRAREPESAVCQANNAK